MEGARPKSGLKFKDIINITASLPAERSRDDLIQAAEWMRKTSPLFSDMDKDIVYSVMRNCKCQHNLKDSIVVKQGDKGNSFYVILHGKVSIFVKEEKISHLQELLASDKESDDAESADPVSPVPPEEEDTGRKETAAAKAIRSKFRKVKAMIRVAKITSKPRVAAKPRPDPRIGLGAKVAQLQDGTTFGELALQRNDNRRAASVVTDTDVVFLVVGRDLYNKSIKSFQAKELAQFREFVESQSLFNHWPIKLQNQVIHSISKVKEEANKTVVQQGQPCDGLHFVVKGDIRIIVNSQLHSKMYGEACSETTPHKEPPRSKTPHNLGLHETLKSLSTAHVQIKRREGYAAAENYQKKRHRSLCITGPCQVIGDLEQTLGLGTYIQTIQSETDTMLYHIGKDNLTRLLKLAATHEQALLAATSKAMKQAVFEKWNNRIDHLNMGEELVTIVEFMETLCEPEKKPEPQKTNVTKQEKFLQSLLTSYINGQSPLIKPLVEGSPYYKMMIQIRAQQRRQHEARNGVVRPPFRLHPIKNERRARSITMLQDEIRRRNTSDVDIIVPHRESDHQYVPPDKNDGESITKEATEVERIKDSRPELKPNNLLVRQNSFAANSYGGYLIKPQPLGIPSTIPEEFEATWDDTRDLSLRCNTYNPVLVTEPAATNCSHEKANPVQGRALSFVNQNLQGRFEEECEKERVDPIVFETNQEVELIESKLREFLGYSNLSQSASMIQRMKRIDETKKIAFKPGGRCYVEKTPCRVRRRYQLANHNHVRHHMIDEEPPVM